MPHCDYADVGFENVLAERQIRSALILRKRRQHNRSVRDAVTRAILMCIHRTLELRGFSPRITIADGLRTYLTTG